MRPDIFEIAAYAKNAGLIVALATNGVLINQKITQKIKQAGIRRVSVSFDGADPSTHDIFRGESAFRMAMEGIEQLRKASIPFQINTTIARHNLHQVKDMLKLSKAIGAVALHLFLLVPVGCGVEISDDMQITPEEYEEVLNWLYRAEQEGGIELKATCAPHYFRITSQQQAKDRRSGLAPSKPPSHHRQEQTGGNKSPKRQIQRHKLNTMTKGCLAGTGVCFISHMGEVFPCGYLPVEAGNIRQQSLESVWKTSTVFADLRDPGKLEGNCGRCNFKSICSGCRARAFGASGNMLGEEPFCVYEPVVKI